MNVLDDWIHPWHLAAAIGMIALWNAAVVVNRRAVQTHERTGDPAQGTVIFVEPVRWWFIIWGFAQFGTGLRRAGCRACLVLFRWSGWAGALLVIPDLVRRERLIRKAHRLARRIRDRAAEYPHSPIVLVGYSTGCYVAIEACLQLGPGGPVRRLVLLAGTVSPKFPLERLSGCVERVHNFYSHLDLVNTLGPLLFGSNDRCWGRACGAIGFRSDFHALRQHRWRAGHITRGYCGDHFTIVSPAFVAADVAPLLEELSCRKDPSV